MVFSAVTVLLCCFVLTCGFPDLKCLGKQKNEISPHQICYQVKPDITDQMQDCEAQWLVKDKVVGWYDGNIKFEDPIENATANTAITVVDSEVKYTLDCPSIDIYRRLSCSYSAPQTTSDRGSGNGPSLEGGGFPDWGIAVIVVAGILCVPLIVFIVRKIKRKKSGPEYSPPGGDSKH